MRRSRGRGTAAAFGLVLLLGGLAAGAVMFVYASRLHDKAIDDFARAGVGCRTTLEFDATGTFYVYEETAGGLDSSGDCEPAGQPGQPFGVEVASGPDEVALVPDESITYDDGDHTGRSTSRFVVETEGQYEISVRGPDAGVVAAIGRDPDDGVDRTRAGAIAVAAAGVVLGGLLLVLAGRRSKRASTPSVPDGPGWGQPRDPADRAWPPAPPTVTQRPINPQQPDQPARPMPPPPPLPARTPAPPAPGWAPPVPPPPPPPIPAPEPRLPER
jgi:hypothetical protein